MSLWRRKFYTNCLREKMNAPHPNAQHTHSWVLRLTRSLSSPGNSVFPYPFPPGPGFALWSLSFPPKSRPHPTQPCCPPQKAHCLPPALDAQTTWPCPGPALMGDRCTGPRGALGWEPSPAFMDLDSGSRVLFLHSGLV